jgi:hypothetical protein
MIIGLFFLFLIAIVWFLFIAGFLWRLILFVGGWFGIYALLRIYVPTSAHIALTFGGDAYSWAAVIPTIICIMCLLTTRE